MKEYEIRTKLQVYPTAEAKEGEEQVRALLYLIDGVIPNKLLVIHGNFPISDLTKEVKEDNFGEFNFYLNAPDLHYHIADYGYWPGIDIKECFPTKISANSLLEILRVAKLVWESKADESNESMRGLISKCYAIVNAESDIVPSDKGYETLFKLALTQSKGKSYVVVNNYINLNFK